MSLLSIKFTKEGLSKKYLKICNIRLQFSGREWEYYHGGRPFNEDEVVGKNNKQAGSPNKTVTPRPKPQDQIPKSKTPRKKPQKPKIQKEFPKIRKELFPLSVTISQLKTKDYDGCKHASVMRSKASLMQNKNKRTTNLISGFLVKPNIKTPQSSSPLKCAIGICGYNQQVSKQNAEEVIHWYCDYKKNKANEEPCEDPCEHGIFNAITAHTESYFIEYVEIRHAKELELMLELKRNAEGERNKHCKYEKLNANEPSNAISRNSENAIDSLEKRNGLKKELDQEQEDSSMNDLRNKLTIQKPVLTVTKSFVDAQRLIRRNEGGFILWIVVCAEDQRLINERLMTEALRIQPKSESWNEDDLGHGLTHRQPFLPLFPTFSSPEREHSWLYTYNVLLKEQIENGVINRTKDTICELRQFHETRERKKLFAAIPFQFLCSTTNSARNNTNLLSLPTSIAMELMMRVMKSMMKYCNGNANEDAKISSLRGSVAIWQIANLDIFILKVKSLPERLLTDVCTIW